MDEDTAQAGHPPLADRSVTGRLDALASAVPPLEIAEIWVFPPLAELESSAEFFLFTRFLEGERRLLCSARLQREDGSPARQVVVEHGSVPANRVPRLVERLQRRLGGEGGPVHVLIDGREARWREFLAGGANGVGPGNGDGVGRANGAYGNGARAGGPDGRHGNRGHGNGAHGAGRQANGAHGDGAGGPTLPHVTEARGSD